MEQSCLVYSSWETEQENNAREEGAKDQTKTPGHTFMTHPDAGRSVLHQSPRQMPKAIELTLLPNHHTLHELR